MLRGGNPGAELLEAEPLLARGLHVFLAMNNSHDALVRDISLLARPFQSAMDLQPLIDQLGRKRIVMLGEATHGTHEFYHWRRLISEELIEKHGFNLIAVEGDWPPCQAINAYAQGNREGHARDALQSFTRWPTWMWANREVEKLAEWLRHHNAAIPEGTKVGFHGLDVYSLFESIDATLEQLEKINPFLARRARIRYACFDPFDRDERKYAESLVGFPEGCEEQVIQNLQDLLKFRLDGFQDRESALFDAKQNARIVQNAERYYRAMVHGGIDSWNIRDRHMMETLEILLNQYGPQSKAIVWAHNTHIGDYRATDMVDSGEINIGGLARERYGDGQVALAGFGTYEGTVIASHAWDGAAQIMTVPPAKPGSHEDAFHQASHKMGYSRLLMMFDKASRHDSLSEFHGHRAIGVVYDPKFERWGNYVPTRLANRYDAFLFLEQTQALEYYPISFEREEIPETWPRGQ